jgi:pilus assembly protein Flp/PilA
MSFKKHSLSHAAETEGVAHDLQRMDRAVAIRSCRSIQNSRRVSEMQNLLKRLWLDEQGQDLVEYALLLVLIALAAAATVQTLGTAIKSVFTNASTALAGYTT